MTLISQLRVINTVQPGFSVCKNTRRTTTVASRARTPEVRRRQVSTYSETETEWVDRGNRLLVFCVWAETERSERRREGANTAVKTGVILQLGDQRWPTLSVAIMAVILLPLSLSLSTQRVTLAPVDQATELAWHHSSSCRSLHLYWTSFCVGLDYGPWHPEGNCHYNGTTARQGHAHMATLSGAIMLRGPLSGFIFSPSSCKAEVKGRPCLNCFEWRSITDS